MAEDQDEAKRREQKEQRDIDFLLEFREFKGVVNTKLDRALDDIKDVKENTAGQLNDHETRIKYLEQYKGAIVTNSGLLWGAWGILLSVLVYHILKQ